MVRVLDFLKSMVGLGSRATPEPEPDGDPEPARVRPAAMRAVAWTPPEPVSVEGLDPVLASYLNDEAISYPLLSTAVGEMGYYTTWSYTDDTSALLRMPFHGPLMPATTPDGDDDRIVDFAAWKRSHGRG